MRSVASVVRFVVDNDQGLSNDPISTYTDCARRDGHENEEWKVESTIKNDGRDIHKDFATKTIKQIVWDLPKEKKERKLITFHRIQCVELGKGTGPSVHKRTEPESGRDMGKYQ